MVKKKISDPFKATLTDLLVWFRKSPVQGLIIGGVAVSLLSRPRFTEDIDAMILLDGSKWASFLESGAQFGFVSRIPDPLHFARRTRMLLLKHIESKVEVDISLGGLPFEEESMRRKQKVKMAGITIPLPTPEDLVIMKAVAHRKQDLADVVSIIESNSRLSLSRIRKWVKEFARVLEMPEIYTDLDKLLKKKS
ncbi:MAG: nucleotidyl transferase AbiEii/AbiGii toxin family protein [Deltaproteobacteria bacterium]|nr:nucleotidyl transferase AbiEii/AbiGii toxin family protein [Deltaproteobacteria bacterium]